MKHEHKREVQNPPIVNALIKSYRETGAEYDPLGMYTGITREMSSMGIKCVACPDTKTPTDAILNGKTYRSRAALENTRADSHLISYADAMPQQDADDL